MNRVRSGRRGTLVLAIAGAVVLALPAAITLASAPGQRILPEEQAVVDMVNEERAKVNRKPLLVNYQLQVAAWLHNEHMVKTGCFSHTTCGDGGPSDRVQKSGYKGGMVGENIAQGYRTPAEVMDGWMHSSGHRANILNANYIDIGVAYNPSGPTWTQVFAVPDPNVATVTPPSGSGPETAPCDLPDFNGDRTVSDADVDLTAAQLMLTAEDAAWNAKYDLVKDQVINVYDVYAVSMKVGQSCPK